MAPPAAGKMLSIQHPIDGFWKYYGRIRNAGDIVNHKRLHRIYKQMKLPLRRKVKKRLPGRVKTAADCAGLFYPNMEY